jgi:hypothetical protein
MADTLNQTLVTQFTDMVNLEAQQTESFFRSRVMTKPVKGKRFDWQNLAATDDNEQTSRHQLVNLGDPQHERRGAIVKTFHQTWGVDRQDDLQSLIELGSPYVKNLAQTMARRFDRVVATAALGSILTGEEFSTTTSAATDGVQTVDCTSTGLTYDKLREIVDNFYEKGIGLTADEKLYLAISNQEHNTLLNEIEILSSDYRRNEFSVESGKVTNALGMGIIVFPSSPKGSNPILDVTGGVRSSFAFASSGICVGINSDIEVRVEDRPDLVDTKQVKALFRLGALRTEGSKVVKVTSTAS